MNGFNVSSAEAGMLVYLGVKKDDTEAAKPMYERFVELLRGYITHVETGVFQAVMRVTYANEGPITILLDS
jgi:D-Tyr-tRNAtyr deacylase